MTDLPGQHPGGAHCDVGPAPLTAVEAEAAFQVIVRHSPDCIKLLDERERIVWVNPMGCRLLEIDDPSRVIGVPWLELWPEPARPDVAAAIHAARSGSIGRFTQPCPTFEGTPKWWHVIVTSVRTDEGRPMLLSLSRDVTDLVALLDQERTLAARANAARAVAEREREQKDELLATVSHELRVPLNTVLSWAVMLQAPVSGQTAGQIARRIERATNEQIDLIERLMEDHRLEHDSDPAALETVDVHQAVADSLAVLEPEAARRGLQLTCDFRAGEHQVSGDPRRLRQVLINLLSNAVKFTARGSITVSLESDGARSRISVRDTGIGMDAAFLDRVFDRYSQEKRVDRGHAKGLGLGLHVVKRLVEAQGGTVSAESAGPGLGAVFTIVLPAAKAPMSADRGSELRGAS